jgi:hypothetical protein
MSGQKLPNNALDDVTSAASINMRRRVVEVLNQLADLLPVESGAWTPVVRGSGTAGTYEIATNKSRYRRNGRTVHVDLFVVLAGTITGGGTDDIRIDGLPYATKDETYAVGAVLLSGVNWTAGANLSIAPETSASPSSTLVLLQTLDDATNTQVAVAGLAADDIIVGSLCYETDDL